MTGTGDMTNRLKTALLEAQNDDGGWSVDGSGPSQTEATALAVLAGGSTAPASRGAEWLGAHQRPDGAWPPWPSVDLTSWATPLAVLALSEIDGRAAKAGAEWLLDQGGRGYPWYTKLFYRLFPDREVIELDADLTGWPWLPDTFSWVEPTAYALIALKSLRDQLPPHAAARIDEGERMILDRTCPGGGWNYGNSRVLDEDLWPYPDTTALALIALQDAPLGDEISASLEALEEMLEHNQSGLALSLSILCLKLYDRPTEALEERLVARLDEVVAYRETRSVALSLMALERATNPFALGTHDRS
jgi:hypothetical protein